MTNSFLIDSGFGIAAVDHNEQTRRGDGYGVIDPDTGACVVSLGTQTLGQSDTLSVASGDVLVDGTEHTISQTNIGIDASNQSDPRRDLVYIDTNGSVAVAKGAAEAAEPTGENLSRFEFYRPAPPDLAQTKATVLAEVWVPAGASSVTSDDLRDRRMSTIGKHSVDFSVVAESDLPVAGDGLTDNNGTFDITPTDFAGDGLEDDGSDNLAVQERINYEPGHTEWEDALSDEEVKRIVPPSGTAVVIETLAFRQKGGGTDANVSVTLYDDGAASQLASVTLGSDDRTGYTAGSGNTVLVRVSNSSGANVDAEPIVRGHIE